MLYHVSIRSARRIVETTAEAGERLLDILVRAGVEIGAPCGGRCFCGKCRVRAKGALVAMHAEEAKFFTQEEIDDGWRLACACRVEGDARVEIPGETDASILTEGGAADTAFDPDVCMVSVRVPAPSLTDQRGDDVRLADALGEKEPRFTARALRNLPAAVRAEETWALTRAGEIVDVAGAPLSAVGVAVDVGTTTIAAYLVDLLTGERLETASRLNPQRTFGADVISRADYARTREGGLAEEAACVREAVREMTREMLARRELPGDCVLEYAIVGNTIMQHLFCALSPEHIAVTPFIPAYTRGLRLPAREAGLLPDDARVTMMPCVAGYVGADTVAAILSCDMDKADGVSLLLDIGTNGEIALGGKERMLCCSAAAGPAFEGAHIQCGTGAVTGAIDHVKVEDGAVVCSTIGGVKAVGICGSGLVDAIAQMLDAGVIDETGRIDEDEAPESILTEFEGKPAVRIAEGVILCQKDVREVQLAKGAIAAGIDVLMREMGVGMDDIARVYLAGGFGNFIAKESACRIGLLPQELLGKIVPIGNAAGAGAQRQLRDRAINGRAEALRERMRYVELSARPDFQELFADRMLFE